MIRFLFGILASLLLNAATSGQRPTAPTAIAPQVTAGWLIELLDRNHSHARKVYDAIGHDETAPAEEQRIAAARLAELDRITMHGRPSRNSETPELDHQRYLGQKFADSLAMPPGPERQRALQTLREQVFESNSPLHPRPYLEGTLRQLRDARNTTMARLSAEIARARTRDDAKTVLKLRRQLWRLRWPALPRERLDQINRRPLAVIAQRYLQGKTQSAQGMTLMLHGRRFRDINDLQSFPLPKKADHRKLLAKARKRLQKHLQKSELSAFEQQVLENLAQRLADLDEAGLADEALALLAPMPYYGNLFLR